MSNFQELLESATSPVEVSDPDEDVVNELCNMIWELEVDPKKSLMAIHSKIANENPIVSYNALVVLENAFYKCGSFIHGSICTPSYMELLKNVILSTKHKRTREKILEMLSDWLDKFEHLHQFNKPIKNLMSQLESSHSEKYDNMNATGIERLQNKFQVNTSGIDSKLASTKECSVNIVKCDLKVSKI